MHLSYLIPTILLLGNSAVQASAIVERAVQDGPCTGSGGAPGVCVPTGKCTSAGGKFIHNACPNLPEDIKCCTKTTCGPEGNGNCRFTSSCKSSTLTGLCPGPADFKCCVPGGSGGGGGGGGGPFPAPSIPSVGVCKAPAVSGAKAVVAAHKGQVREIYCIRDCACNSASSDHCCGLAIDFMCSSAGGVRTSRGEPIAEWVMNNRASLNLKYVIWGQKIWSPTIDKVAPWSQWRGMEDRGSITENHWDHVHVSFNG